MEKSLPVNERKPSPLKAWFLASRPKTLTVSFAPILVITSLAQSLTGSISLSIALFALISSILITIGTNMVNDALDFKKGTDTGARLGFMRVTQAGLLSSRQVLTGGFLCYIFALLFGIPLMLQGGWPIVFILLTSVLCGYLYTGGPAPLGYHGLGEVFCFTFYGPVITLSVFYLQTGFLDATAWLAAIQMGMLNSVLMAIQNLRDIESDSRANKRTLAVRYGRTFARWEIAFLALGPFAIGILWMLWDYDFAAWLPFIVFPLAYRNVHAIWVAEPSYRYNSFFAYSSLVYFIFSFLLSLGLLIH